MEVDVRGSSGGTCRLVQGPWAVMRPALSAAQPSTTAAQGVEAEAGGVFHQVLEIGPRGRLATGKVHLEHTERRRLLEHRAPSRGVQLLGKSRDRSTQSRRSVGRSEGRRAFLFIVAS